MPCCCTNATSLNNKMPEFLASIETYKPKTIFVTETWWHESSITNIEKYMLFRKDRVYSREGEVAIYVDTSLKPNEVRKIVLLDSPEQIWCEISYGSEHILLGCIYRRHMLDPLENIETSIIKANELLSIIYSGLLICGDFNLPGINWDFSSIPTISNTDTFSSSQSTEVVQLARELETDYGKDIVAIEQDTPATVSIGKHLFAINCVVLKDCNGKYIKWSYIRALYEI
ncbi:uncharacterized protein LOC101236549 [Hydra vulgaris]|uniref:uncharacterized protein LOC101236549 n=1 Tax=Hydra vulgaris TaxID=6087 RepID=UPI001F5FAD66|nr:uncharacterized protein LOC101236549 [Hydra vulgaris]